MLLGALVLFVVSLGYGVVVPVLPGLAERAGRTDAHQLSIVYAAYSASKIAAQIPGGVWVDRSGVRRVLGVGLAAYVLSMLAFVWPLPPLALAVVRAVEGAATGLVYPAVFAHVLARGPSEAAGKRIGGAIGMGSAGLLVGPVVGVSLARFGAEVPIVVAAGAGALALIAVLARRGDDRPSRPRTLGAELRLLRATVATVAFVVLALPIAFNKLVFSSCQGLLPLVGREHLGLGDRGVMGLFVLTGVVFGVAQPVGGALVDRFAPRSVVLASMPLLLGSLAALALATRPAAFYLLFGVHVLGQSIIFVATMKEILARVGQKDSHGGVVGALATWTDLMTVVGPLLLLNVYASLAMGTFAVAALIGAIFALGYAAYRPASA